MRVTLPGKRPIRNLRDTNHRINTGPKPERLVLRHEHLGADDVGVHQREHEGRSGLHQAAVVDVALRDHTVERRHHTLVGLLLLEYSNLGLLGCNIRLRHAHRGLLRLQGQAIIVALLERQPSLFDEIAVARIGDLGEVAACLRLLQRGLVLGQRRLGLRNLVVEFGGGNVRQQGAGLDLIADVDVALLDVAAGAREDVRRFECGRRRRQADGHLAVAGADRGDANIGNKRPALLRGGRDIEVGLVVAPASYSKAAQRAAAARCRRTTRLRNDVAACASHWVTQQRDRLRDQAGPRTPSFLGRTRISLIPELPRIRHGEAFRRCPCAAWRTGKARSAMLSVSRTAGRR